VSPDRLGAHSQEPYRPEAEGHFALPQHEFDLDVITLVGSLRYAEHRSAGEIRQGLCRRGLAIAPRTVGDRTPLAPQRTGRPQGSTRSGEGRILMAFWLQADLTAAVITAVIIGPVAALLCFVVVWSHRRAEFLLRRWAEQNGFHIIAQKERKFFRGPFFWNSSKNQMVYHVTVEDAGGNLCSGFVRLGSWTRSIFSDNIEANWGLAGRCPHASRLPLIRT
jgi:hypothetical protein